MFCQIQKKIDWKFVDAVESPRRLYLEKMQETSVIIALFPFATKRDLQAKGDAESMSNKASFDSEPVIREIEEKHQSAWTVTDREWCSTQELPPFQKIFHWQLICKLVTKHGMQQKENVASRIVSLVAIIFFK